MTLTIEIHELQTPSTTEVVARLDLADDGSVDFSEAGEVESFLRHFVCGLRRDGQFVTCEDGEEWLRLLPVHLRGTYCWAQAASTAPSPSR